jgi:putative hydrolase of the HAD superfamily
VDAGAAAVSEIRALLFDLGGVIVELDWDRAFAAWARAAKVDAAQLRQRFSFDEPYQRHERGEIRAVEYYDALNASLGIDVPHEVLDQGWRDIFASAIEPTASLLRELHGSIPLYAFSNTNPVHYDAWSTRFREVLTPFEHVFTSCDIGARKPDRAAFEHVARAIGVAPEAILFFDDTEENIRGARAIGMPAVLVRGPGDVRAAVSRWLVQPAGERGVV